MPSSVYATGNEKTNPYLELVSKLLFDPCCHLRLCSVHGQKHVILEVDYLREYRESLADILRESWGVAGGRGKPEACCVERNACLSEIFARENGPSYVNAPSNVIKECMSLKICITPLGDFCELFKR